MSRRAITSYRFLAFSICLALTPSAARAQQSTGSIEGRVSNPATGDYLNNARVTIVGSSQTVLTDSTGVYQFATVKLGKIVLRVEYPNLGMQEFSVEVVANRVVTQNVEMTTASYYGKDQDAPVVLDAFTVNATREMAADVIATNEQRYAPGIKNVIAADSFGDVSEGNVGEFVKRLPGVSVNYAEGDANNISLRGFSGSMTGITIDGGYIASAASSVPGRTIDLEQISITNVSRVEVFKTVLPNMWASSLGGSVNLVGKSSFERSKPLLSIRALTQFTNEDYELKKTPGPGSKTTSKLRPGLELSYIRPVTKDFGFSVSALYSDQFGRKRQSDATWEFTTAAGGSEANPFLRGLRLSDNARETERTSVSLGADWRPFASLTLHVGYQHNTYDLFTAPRTIAINTGTLPTAFTPTSTQGRAAAGTLQFSSTWWSKYGQTDNFTLRGEQRIGEWKLELAGNYSYSNNHYRVMSEGFLRGITARALSPTVEFTSATSPTSIGNIIATSATIPVLDWTNEANYRIISSDANEDRNTDVYAGEIRLNARRAFTLADRPAAVVFGAAMQHQERSRVSTTGTYSYIGPTGVANSPATTAAGIADTVYVNRRQDFGWPSTIIWPDMVKAYQLYQANPGYFVFDAPAAYQFEATAADRFTEMLKAAYLQGEIKLFQDRLQLVGGVRYEETIDKGVGLKIDTDAGYQHNANGTVVRNAAGAPVVITDLLARARAQYIKYGAVAFRDYHDLYPSLTAKYNLTSNFVLRLGYSETIGRPDLANTIPRVTVDDEATSSTGRLGTINLRNAGLKPWKSNNFDLSLEYYFARTGVVSLGVFRKFIHDPFRSQTRIVDAALAAEFDLPTTYVGYDFTSTFNTREVATITGIELDFRQQLSFLPTWASGLSVFANGTLLDLDGPRDADYGDLYQKTANWGLSYSRGPVGLQLNWNYQGLKRTANLTFGPNAATYRQPRLTLDISGEYRLTRHFSLFLNARNVTDAVEAFQSYSDNSPAYSHYSTASEYGVKYSAGIRGHF